MAGRGAKRKLKKLRRETEEASSVLTQCMHMLSLHGYTVSLPYEVPRVLQELLNGVGSPQVVGPGANPKQVALARLQGPSSVPQSAPAASGPGMSFVEPEPEADLADFNFSNIDFDPAAVDSPQIDSVVSGAGDGMLPPISEEEMLERVNAANDRMMHRVSTTGVKHRRGQGPPELQGRRIQPAPGAVSGNGAPQQEESLDALMENSEPAPASGGGRINRVTGMSLEQQREVIGRVTGKVPGAPGGGPVAKPSG